MKNSKNLKHIIDQSTPEQIMKDFSKVDKMLDNIDLMNEISDKISQVTKLIGEVNEGFKRLSK